MTIPVWHAVPGRLFLVGKCLDDYSCLGIVWMTIPVWQCLYDYSCLQSAVRLFLFGKYLDDYTCLGIACMTIPVWQCLMTNPVWEVVVFKKIQNIKYSDICVHKWVIGNTMGIGYPLS